jgi:hypothetical protein
MYVQRRNVTTEGLHLQRQRVGVEGVCVGIRLYVMDGAKGGSGREGISSRRRKRDVQRKQSFPILPSYTPLAFSLCGGFSHRLTTLGWGTLRLVARKGTGQDRARATGMTGIARACAVGCSQCLASASRSVTQLSDGRRRGQGRT